jgi:hypothetical protein
MSIRTLTNLTLRDKNLNDTDNIFEDLITLKELVEVIIFIFIYNKIIVRFK